jgi:hypothetical protein
MHSQWRPSRVVVPTGAISGLSNSKPSDSPRSSKSGTRRVRLICTHEVAISSYRFSKFAPALSGLPPDPAPPLCLTQPHKGACASGKAGGAPSLALWSCAGLGLSCGRPRPGGTGSAGCAGRSGAPRGSLGRVSNTRPIVLAGCGLLNTRRDTCLGAVTSDKAGAGKSQANAGSNPIPRGGQERRSTMKDHAVSMRGDSLR